MLRDLGRLGTREGERIGNSGTGVSWMLFRSSVWGSSGCVNFTCSSGSAYEIPRGKGEDGLSGYMGGRLGRLDPGDQRAIDENARTAMMRNRWTGEVSRGPRAGKRLRATLTEIFRDHE